MRMLVLRLRPAGALGLSFAVLLSMIIGLGVALGGLIENGDAPNGIDGRVLDWFIRRRQSWITIIARSVTTLGSSPVLLALVVVVGFVSWRRGRSLRTLLTLAASYSGSHALFIIVKLVTVRPRPSSTYSLGYFSGYAFPSGHATQAAAVYFTLAALVASRTNRRSTTISAWAIAALTVTAIGFTRPYLGAHWLTDVLAGWALGTLWCASVLAAIRAVENVHRSDNPSS